MERVISSEITKFLFLLGAGSVALYLLIANQIGNIRGAFKSYQKATLVYLIIALLLFAMVAIAAYPAFFESPFAAFVCFQAFFLLLGSAHIYLMPNNLKWAQDEKSFVPEMLFTFLVGIFGSISFLIVYHLINKNRLEYIMASAILFFIIPFFFYYAFKKATAIPPKILKEWFYPVSQQIEEPDDSKMKNLLVISFEFKKQPGEPRVTNFRAKAPTDMEFGQLFYYFINDYNERNPNNKIQFVNGAGEPHGWVFYKKPQWHSLMTQYIDGDKTIFNNRIKENDVIICTRTLL